MTLEDRVKELEAALLAHHRDTLRVEDLQSHITRITNSRVANWRALALRAAIVPNPWAAMWKYMAKYWRNSYKIEKRAHHAMEALYIETIEGVAKKLERVADRQGPGGLCETEHEREILKMLAGEIRGGRWR